MKATCHCGAIEVSLAHAPEYINLCDCSLCLKSGGAWGYFETGEVEVMGETHSYRRTDYATPAVEMHFCPRCGSTTHWLPTENLDEDRMGVNMRLFEPAQLAGVEARTLDGRNWFGKSAAAHRRQPGAIGKEVFL